MLGGFSRRRPLLGWVPALGIGLLACLLVLSVLVYSGGRKGIGVQGFECLDRSLCTYLCRTVVVSEGRT